MTISNPTPWRVADNFIYDANGDFVDIWPNAQRIVRAVNAYVEANTQLTVLDGELGDRWQSQRFDRNEQASIDGEWLTIEEWLNRIGAIELQIVKGADSYVVWAKGTR